MVEQSLITAEIKAMLGHEVFFAGKLKSVLKKGTVH